MINLEQSIADWRRQMADGGINSSAVLDELESHLRDDCAQRLRVELDVQKTFEAAVQQIGPAGVLKHEFKIAGETSERKFMKRVLIISAGVIGVLVGMAFVMPAVAQYRHEGAMTSEEVILILLGIVLTLGGASGALLGAMKRSA